MTYHEGKKKYQVNRGISEVPILQQAFFLPDGLTANSYFGLNFYDAHFHVGSQFLINLRFC